MLIETIIICVLILGFVFLIKRIKSKKLYFLIPISIFLMIILSFMLLLDLLLIVGLVSSESGWGLIIYLTIFVSIIDFLPFGVQLLLIVLFLIMIISLTIGMTKNIIKNKNML